MKTIRMKTLDYSLFFRQAVRNPLQFSTIFPTTEYLSNKIVSESSIKKGDKIIELGCGSGAITRQILKKIDNPENFVGLELDEKLTSFLKSQYPKNKFIADSAESIHQHLENSDYDKVIASLPWTMIDSLSRERTLHAVHETLKPGGEFIFFITLHAMFFKNSKVFLEQVSKNFSKIEKKEIVFKNLPPAQIFKAS